jgi:hypothetical protein
MKAVEVLKNSNPSLKPVSNSLLDQIALWDLELVAKKDKKETSDKLKK